MTTTPVSESEVRGALTRWLIAVQHDMPSQRERADRPAWFLSAIVATRILADMWQLATFHDTEDGKVLERYVTERGVSAFLRALADVLDA